MPSQRVSRKRHSRKRLTRKRSRNSRKASSRKPRRMSVYDKARVFENRAERLRKLGKISEAEKVIARRATMLIKALEFR